MSRLAIVLGILFALPGAATAAGPPCETVPGNLVENCGFESPQVPEGSFSSFAPGTDMGGWTVVPGGDSVDLVNRNAFGGYPVDNGAQAVDLNSNREGGVARAVATVPGRVYRLGFQLSGYPAASAACPATQPQVVRVSAGGEEQTFSFTPSATASPPGAQAFDAHAFDFDAESGPSTRIVFQARSTGCAGPVIDDVVVVPASSPAPELGRSMTGRPVSGTVLVRPPGTNRFQPLRLGTPLPVGTVVDARRGRVRLTATSGGAGYTADFYAGVFRLAQRSRRGATADLELSGGSFRRCPAGLRGAAAAKRIRQLWGDGNGRFRTIERFSSATIRGTTWLTEDRCDGTLTRVTRGSVSVRDFVRRRTVVVRAPRSYLAAGRRR